MSVRHLLFLLLGLCALPSVAAAQNNQVLVVPFAQENPSLPHPAHEGAPITLKAIIRNATCTQYNVWWDVDRDNDFEAAELIDLNGGVVGSVTVEDGSVYDIGRTFSVPQVDHDMLLPINVKVTGVSGCPAGGAPTAFGTFRLYVYNWSPNTADVTQWTPEQVAILGQMSAQESMWYMHRWIGGRGGAGTSGLHGLLKVRDTTGLPANNHGADSDNERTAVGSLAAWLFTINGHLPAYPPGTLVGNAPAGWHDKNNARWHADPYAETTIRLVNGILRRGSGTVAVAAADEDNTCGFGRPACVHMARDQRGAYVLSSNNVYYQGILTAGLSTMTPALAGTRVQVGTFANNASYTWEYFVQQMVDYLGYQQIDGGDANGGWLYTAFNGPGGLGDSDASTSQWAYIALDAAETAGRQHGVIVNNRHKYRIADNLVKNQRGNGGAAYRSSTAAHNFQLTGGAIVAARWIGLQNFDVNDGNVAFPGYTSFNYTKGRLRKAYNDYLTFTANNWAQQHQSGVYQDRLFQRGSYLCGNSAGVYNTGLRCGNSYGMYSHQKGYRTGTPEIEFVGNHDWVKQFTTYYVRAQDRALNDYTRFGRVFDTFCEGSQVTCNHSPGLFSSAQAGLVMTPSLFNPKPVAIGAVEPPVVVEGCAGGNNGLVTFSHGASFHPNANTDIDNFRWDVDSNNGLWWNVANAPVDFATLESGQSFTYRYQRAGNYTATLEVEDSVHQKHQVTVAVQVNEAANVAPAVAHGGPYVLEQGQPLRLLGNATDANQACGKALTVAWDIDGDGDFADGVAAAASTEVPWASLAGLPIGQPVTIRIRARDHANLEAIAQTTLTIYPVNPVANATANPNPAACRQNVTFNGAQSFHPNPNRSIRSYEWDVNRDGTFEGGGPSPQFVYAFDQYGTYNVRLKVTDDLDRSATSDMQVVVDQGNQAPVARTSQANYVVLEGDALTLDGRLSLDPNANCGDSIVSYEWDINGNGQFGQAGIDAVGAQPNIPWAVLSTLRWPADRDTGLPANTVTLRVTDEFGATSTVNFTITIFRANPVAVVVQNPNPAPINLASGLSNPTLDGRESSSPVPGQRVVRYDWDLDDNGTYEVQNEPFVEFRKVFNPIPRPDNIPETHVRLQVTDDQGRTNSTRYRVNYNVPPTLPTADADPTDPPERGYHILLGQGVTLDARQSSDPDSAEFGDFLAFYRWDLNYTAPNADFDHELADPNGDKQEATLSLTAQELAEAGIVAPGNYTVLLEVEDSQGLTNRDTAPLNVYARDPVALASANPSPAACGQAVTFSGARSDHPHPDIDVRQWQWDLDGDTQYDDANGEVINHTFNQFTFGVPVQVGLRVTDSIGNSGTTTIAMVVDQGNQAPVSNPGGPYAIAVGENVTLDGRGSSDPNAACGDRIVRYDWDFNNDGSFEFGSDNNGQQAVTWAQLPANMRQAGNYSVALRVRDRFGVTTTSNVAFRVVSGPQAVATATPNRAGCNAQVVFDGAQSRTDGPSPGFDIVAWDWDFDGDGTFETSGQRHTRAVVGNGQYTARLRVTDRTGRTSIDNAVVTIEFDNVAPVASAGGPYFTGPLPGGGFAAVALDARGSRDPNAPCDAIDRYEWDLNNDGTFGDLNQFGAQLNYSNPLWQIGLTYVVRVRVRDGAGVYSLPAETTIEVRNVVAPTGEILSPRAAPEQCQGAGDFPVTFRLTDPAGPRQVTVVALIAGVVVGQTVVPSLANGQPVNGQIVVPGANLPQGSLDLQLRFEAGGASNVVNAGGRLTFDRTPPDIVVNNLANQCYNPNAVPQPQVVVTDAIDLNPQVQTATNQNACQRVLVVTARDRCNNVRVRETPYMVGQPLDVTINGANEGQLVPLNTAMSWVVNAPAGCVAGNVQATLQRTGQAAGVYEANTPIVESGNHSLRLTLQPCGGVGVPAQNIQRNFTVNAPPVGVPITANHPNGNGGQYVVNEGAGLQLDGSDSRPPEQADRIANYEWDFTGDGTFDAQGATVNFPTDNNGTFNGALRVTDSLNASHTVPFRVVVNDVSPVANPGGPYTVAQGVALQLDGSGSRAGHAADPIALYTWHWADGTPSSAGANLTRPQHTWATNGVYNVRLVVRDEDNEVDATVRVEVTDVDPQIAGVDAPVDPHELAEMTFTARATPGAPADPITNYQWYLGNDLNAAPIAAGQNASTLRHRFRDAGDYVITVRVSDGDSSSVQSINVRVREITLDELLAETQVRVNNVRQTQAGERDVIDELDLPGSPLRIEDWIARGRWGERHGYRGNSFVALDQITLAIAFAQSENGRFSDLLWAISRQMVRETTRMRQRIVVTDELVSADDPQIVRADQFLALVQAAFDGANFERDVNGNNPLAMRGLYANAVNAYFYLANSIDPCTTGGPYELDANNPDIVQRVLAANEDNDALNVAMNGIDAQMTAYLGAGAQADDLGPARAEVQSAKATLAEIRNLMRQRIGIVCQEGQCINDRDALDLELKAMDLVGSLNDVAEAGAWTRQWQACLVSAVKFRIELSLLRVEFACGVNTAVAINARRKQAEGLAHVEAQRNEAALNFYAHPDQRCLLIRTYNDCLVPAFSGENAPYEFPDICVNDNQNP